MPPWLPIARVNYTEGMTLKQIAARYGVTEGTVRYWFKRTGTPTRGRGRRPTARLNDRAWLEEKYVVERLSAFKIAALAGCSQDGVLGALHRHGIAVRSRGGAKEQRRSLPPQLRDPTWLRDRYVTHGLSAERIAQETGASPTAVYNALKRSGISRAQLPL